MIDKLKAMQRDLNETDAVFAKRMEISRSSWQMLRTGKTKKPGYKTLAAILRTYPGLVSCLQNDNISASEAEKLEK